MFHQSHSGRSNLGQQSHRHKRGCYSIALGCGNKRRECCVYLSLLAVLLKVFSVVAFGHFPFCYPVIPASTYPLGTGRPWQTIPSCTIKRSTSEFFPNGYHSDLTFATHS